MKHLVVLLVCLVSFAASAREYCVGSFAVTNLVISPHYEASCEDRIVKSKADPLLVSKKQKVRLAAQLTDKMLVRGFQKVAEIRGVMIYEKTNDKTPVPHCLIVNDSAKRNEAKLPDTLHFAACSSDIELAQVFSKNRKDVEAVLSQNRFKKVADTQHGPLYRLKSNWLF